MFYYSLALIILGTMGIAGIILVLLDKNLKWKKHPNPKQKD